MISLLSCSALEGIKKRIHEVHQRNYAKKRRAEIIGMPPSYITVETSYDCLPSHSKAENMELHNYSISRKVCETSSLYKSVLQVVNNCKISKWSISSVKIFLKLLFLFIRRKEFSMHSFFPASVLPRCIISKCRSFFLINLFTGWQSSRINETKHLSKTNCDEEN